MPAQHFSSTWCHSDLGWHDSYPCPLPYPCLLARYGKTIMRDHFLVEERRKHNTCLIPIQNTFLPFSLILNNNRAVNMGVSHQKIICLLNPRPRRVSKLWREICTFMTQKITSIFRNFCTNSTTASTLQCGAQHGIKRKVALSYPSYMSKVNAHYERIDP